jgi:transposase InsO family protein
MTWGTEHRSLGRSKTSRWFGDRVLHGRWTPSALRREGGVLVDTPRSATHRPRYPNLVEDVEVTRRDQVRVADITYIRLREEFVYLAVLMDVFTRRVQGWELGRSLDQGLTLAALRRRGVY